MKNVTTSPTLAELTRRIREVNIEKGWRAPDGGPCPGQTFGDYIALLHSEVAEALEAYRDHRFKDATATGSCAFGDDGCDIHPFKPEGVGSEFADVLIRLLDMADVFGVRISGYAHLADVRDTGTVSQNRLPLLETFGDHLSWLHCSIDTAWINPASLPHVLRVLVTVARKYGIDLEREVVRKIAYNRTRAFQHGGRTLAGPARQVGAVVTRPVLEILLEAFPTDARGWWTGEEADEFIDAWGLLRLPRLTMGDGQGAHYLFWCANAEEVAGMLGVEYDEAEGFRIANGEYSVGIVQAEKK